MLAPIILLTVLVTAAVYLLLGLPNGDWVPISLIVVGVIAAWWVPSSARKRDERHH